MERLIREHYTHLEAEKILAFISEHRVDDLIDKKIDKLKGELEQLRN